MKSNTNFAFYIGQQSGRKRLNQARSSFLFGLQLIYGCNK